MSALPGGVLRHELPAVRDSAPSAACRSVSNNASVRLSMTSRASPHLRLLGREAAILAPLGGWGQRTLGPLSRRFVRRQVGKSILREATQQGGIDAGSCRGSTSLEMGGPAPSADEVRSGRARAGQGADDRAASREPAVERSADTRGVRRPRSSGRIEPGIARVRLPARAAASGRARRKQAPRRASPRFEESFRGSVERTRRSPGTGRRLRAVR